MKAGKKGQRYVLQQRVTQKAAQRKIIVFSVAGVLMFTLTWLYFNFGTGTQSKAEVAYPQMTFSNQTLISGSDGNEGAIYQFSNIGNGIDAQVQITKITGNTTLSDIDFYSSGCGPAWQPAFNIAPCSTSFIEWEIKFKKAGTYIDTVIPSVAIAVSGLYKSSFISQFISAVSPADYYRESSVPMMLSYNNEMLEAHALIEAKNNGSMTGNSSIQFNYEKVKNLILRTGFQNTGNEVVSKMFSMYFKPCFAGNPFPMPSSIVNFSGEKNSDNTISLKWEATGDHDDQNYMIQKSRDGKSVSEIINISGLGKNNGNNIYSYEDKNPVGDRTFYTLSQSDLHGGFVTLKTICIGSADANSPVTIKSATLNNEKGMVNISYGTLSNSMLRVSLTDADRKEICSRVIQAKEGNNDICLSNFGKLERGVYFVNIDNYRMKYKAVKALTN